jgi:crotonobetainyl-CoA:carnitine CoA-transferase CaiB-like acyl-CoA transferase
VIQARATGEGTQLEVAQSDAAAAFDWYREETWRAYERPESEVTGNASDDYVRREPAIAGMVGGVRYQVYASTDGHVLFMASEQHFWKKFCEAVGRPELFERWPGSEYGDHARGNRELQAELTPIFGSKSTAEWVQFGIDVDVPIAPCHTPKSVADDPQFADRFEWFPTEALGAEQLPFPVKIVGADPVVPGKAPELAEHTDAVLADVLGYDAERVAALRAAGALG